MSPARRASAPRSSSRSLPPLAPLLPLAPPPPAPPRLPTRAAAPERKRRHAYHHGNLRQALLDQAVATIRAHGVDALTMRDVGVRLRVSRTALYRHFADKTALLAAVAADGFRVFRLALTDAWESGGRGRPGFEAMGVAYVRFALANPSHYRVMFGGFETKAACDPELSTQAGSAFQVLVQALAEMQASGLVRAGDAAALAMFVWATVHGTAMLAIDGQLAGAPIEGLLPLVVDRIWDAVRA
ncbi:MAG: TetR/AcrR family transcriptional regulator [Acidobacteriota bacterium]